MASLIRFDLDAGIILLIRSFYHFKICISWQTKTKAASVTRKMIRRIRAAGKTHPQRRDHLAEKHPATSRVRTKATEVRKVVPATKETPTGTGDYASVLQLDPGMICRVFF